MKIEFNTTQNIFSIGNNLSRELEKRLKAIDKKFNYTIYINRLIETSTSDYELTIEYENQYSTWECINSFFNNDYNRINSTCKDFMKLINDVEEHNLINEIFNNTK